MTTHEIYEHAFNVLKELEEKNPISAARYSIKRAILELGPNGFPFEQFMANIMKFKGAANVRTDVLLQGRCSEHEVDVVGDMDNKHFGMEIKFHNSTGTRTDMKVVLYVKARWDDLKENNTIDEGWLVTNTRFTRNVRHYAECSKAVRLLGWNYPRDRGLEVVTEEAQLHPITMITSLNNAQKRALLKRDKVLCRDIKNDRETLLEAGVHKDNINKVMQQAQTLCASH
jgi:hypothetical protein